MVKKWIGVKAPGYIVRYLFIFRGSYLIYHAIYRQTRKILVWNRVLRYVVVKTGRLFVMFFLSGRM